MITLAQAKANLLESVTCSLDSECIALDKALGRVLSADLTSTLDIPPADNSAMDGFAVRAADVSAGKPIKISQRIPAGTVPMSLEPGTAARIFTGGVMPAQSDAVVIQENCDFDEQVVTFNTNIEPGDNVRPQGQDIENGAIVAKRGQRLSAIDLSLLTSVGCTQVGVYKPLRVAIFSTGDELVEPGEALQPGQIYNSNRPLLMGMARQLGFEPVDCGIVADTFAATREALAAAAANADIIISSGGVSVGEEDHVKPAVESLGKLDLWKVQMKPGKPVAFGHINNVPFIGLPGNPVSSFVVFQVLARPVLEKMQGQPAADPRSFAVKSGFDKRVTSREEFVRVKLSHNGSGELIADRFPNLSSGVMSSLSWADGLVRQPIDCELKIGQAVEFFPLNQGLL